MSLAVSVRCYWLFTDGRGWTRRLTCKILSAAGQQSRRINTHSSSSCHDTTSSVVYIANLVFPMAVFTSWMLFLASWSIFKYKYFIHYKKFCFLFMQLTVHVLQSSRRHRTIQLSNIYVGKAHTNWNSLLVLEIYWFTHAPTYTHMHARMQACTHWWCPLQYRLFDVRLNWLSVSWTIKGFELMWNGETFATFCVVRIWVFFLCFFSPECN